tara:strand:- start:386 stop:616 length:231 start_codon:yes stop_codon:yes gene_type:complete
MENESLYYGASFFSILLLFFLWFGLGLFSLWWWLFFLLIATTPTVYVYYVKEPEPTSTSGILSTKIKKQEELKLLF